MIRTFIAIDISPEIKTKLDNTIKQLQQKGRSPVKWTAVNRIHITLAFLGDVDEKQLPNLISKISAAAGHFSPFGIRVGGLGVFPKPDRARILWIGCDFDAEGLSMQKAIQQVVTDLGFPKEDRPFSPHLTIGRVANSADPQDYALLANLIRETEVGLLGLQTISGIRIYRSDLLPTGPKYQVLHDISLGS